MLKLKVQFFPCKKFNMDFTNLSICISFVFVIVDVLRAMMAILFISNQLFIINYYNFVEAAEDALHDDITQVFRSTKDGRIR